MTKKTYFGFYVQQRKDVSCPRLFAFYAPTKEILKWAKVERAEDDPNGVQRILRDSRLGGIRRYLENNTANALPNNILVAFPKGIKGASIEAITGIQLQHGSMPDGISASYLAIDFDETGGEKGPALVIDGQHRLFGAAKYDKEDLPILVVAILDASPEEMAFQFIVINNKAVKVPTTLVKSLVANFRDIEVNLSERLLTAGITYGTKSAFLTIADSSSSSPFAGLLSWEKNRVGEKLVDVTTIEAMHSYLKRELAIVLSGDEDSSQAILLTLWNTIRDAYTSIWNDRCPNLFSKVNMLAMNEYAVDRIRNLASMQMVSIFESESIRQAVLRTFKFIPEGLWRMDWSGIRLQDNKAIRELVKNSFEIIANNVMNDRDWQESVKLLSANS